MKIDFDSLIAPEPSSLVGFSQNKLVRDAETRTEETVAEAMQSAEARFYMFSRGRVILHKEDISTITFTRSETEAFQPQFEKALLLGETEDGPKIALPCKVDTETLEEPWTSYDLRSLLYSSSVGDHEASIVGHGAAMLYWHATNRFCGKCGTASELKIGGYRRDCPACGHKIFPRTDPCVIMLPVKGDRCVMGRSPHFPPGWYSTLAGFLEPGETIEDAVRRETFEEAGVQIGRVKYFASQPWPFPHSLMIGLHCEVLSEKITFDDNELEDCRWFSREDVQLMIREEHPDGYICPPNRAISTAIIQAWAEG